MSLGYVTALGSSETSAWSRVEPIGRGAKSNLPVAPCLVHDGMEDFGCLWSSFFHDDFSNMSPPSTSLKRGCSMLYWLLGQEHYLCLGLHLAVADWPPIRQAVSVVFGVLCLSGDGFCGSGSRRSSQIWHPPLQALLQCYVTLCDPVFHDPLVQTCLCFGFVILLASADSATLLERVARLWLRMIWSLRRCAELVRRESIVCEHLLGFVTGLVSDLR